MGSRSAAPSVRSVAGLWHSPTATRNALVVLLAIAAGFSDALGYVGLGRVFTANMTGNTILLGLAIGQGEVPAAWRSVAALVGFVLGIVLAGAVVARMREQSKSIWSMTVTATLAGECLVLLVFTLWGTIASPSSSSEATVGLIVVLATAMGMQSIALHVLGVSGIASTAINTTWIEVICGLSGRFRMIRQLHEHALAEGNSLAGVGVQVMVIGAYLAAAVAAGMAYGRWHVAVAAIPTAVVAIVTMVAFVRFQRSPS